MMLEESDTQQSRRLQIVRIGSFEITCAMRNNVKLIPVYPPSPTTHRREYIEAFKTALEESPHRVRALLFCNPQNPRAQLYSEDLIEDLLTFCDQADLHFISDEVYALTTFGETGRREISEKPVNASHTSKFTSVVHINLERLGVDPSRIHLLHSISKDLGSSGLRLVSSLHKTSRKHRVAQAHHGDRDFSSRKKINHCASRLVC
jgi:aspartate/methionine/tyrosine aminotransferase